MKDRTPKVTRYKELPTFEGPGDALTKVLVSQEVGTDSAGILSLVFPPGGRSDTHTRSAGEYVHVTSGTTEIHINGTVYELTSGDTIHIPAGLEHFHVNTGATELKQIVIFVPAGPEASIPMLFKVK